MNVLVVGSGGREHAICWKLKASSKVDKVFCAPGNAGIANVAECVNIKADDLDKLAQFAKDNNIGLTITGPEISLCAGIVDVFQKNNLRIFGPNKYAAQLEGSKEFAKEFMFKYNIPTGKAEYFSDEKSATEYIKSEFARGEEFVVIKADGLAAGKGVLVAENEKEAIEFTKSCFDGVFGNAGARILIEEYLAGEEASILALVDTKSIRALASSQDHKRIFDNDKGLNTGGMGAYSPAPVVNDEVWEKINRDILANFLKGVQAEKLDFHGIIFVGVMIKNNEPKVLEFNVRFGDPEVQPVLSRLDGDLFDIVEATIDEKLAEAEIKWKESPAVSVVMAAGGYPEDYKKGDEIFGLDDVYEHTVVFHAGTAFKDGKIVTAGGRVLGVCALGDSIESAIKNAYQSVEKISFSDHYYRKDIGQKALK